MTAGIYQTAEPTLSAPRYAALVAWGMDYRAAELSMVSRWKSIHALGVAALNEDHVNLEAFLRAAQTATGMKRVTIWRAYVCGDALAQGVSPTDQGTMIDAYRALSIGKSVEQVNEAIREGRLDALLEGGDGTTMRGHTQQNAQKRDKLLDSLGPRMQDVPRMEREGVIFDFASYVLDRFPDAFDEYLVHWRQQEQA